MSFLNPSNEKPVRTSQKISYFDAALSVFQRPKKFKPQNLKPPKINNTVYVDSSEDLLRSTPSQGVGATSARSSIHRQNSVPASHAERFVHAATPSISNVPIEKHGDPWVSGILRRLPYTGVMALFMVLLCAGADVVILYKSDGKEVDTWTISPSVLLAVFSATANVCLEYARAEGVILAWWRKALRGGTLYDLSRYWESGDSILGAVKSGRDFNVVALATVVASAIVLDGPLLQKASSVVSKPMITTVNVTAPIAQELPYGFTATGSFGWIEESLNASGPGLLVMNQTFAQVVNSYIIGENITSSFTGCTGKCSGTVKAAGLAIDCSSKSVPWSTNKTGDATHVIFSSNFTMIPGTFGGVPEDYGGTGTVNPFPGTPFVQFDLLSVSGRVAPFVAEGTPGGTNGGPAGGGEELQAFCNGTMVRKTCSLRSATLDYPIEMDNGTISLVGNSSAYTVDQIQQYGDTAPAFPGDPNPMTFITLGGIAAAARNMFTARAEQDDLGFLARLDGSLASQYIDYGPEGHDFITTMDACAINWNKDPTDDIVNALNNMMFRTALAGKDFPKYKLINGTTDQWWSSYFEAFPPNITAGDNGLPIPQTITMKHSSTVNIFQSHYSYLGAALAVMMAGVLVVIPTFNGFWELGRSTSLNPLEIAKAFNPDILGGTGSNASTKHLDKTVGKMEVKYGEMIDERVISGGSGYAEDDVLRFRGRRLELGDPSRIRAPEFQALYH